MKGKFADLNPAGTSVLLFMCAKLKFWDEEMLKKIIDELIVNQPFKVSTM